MTARLSPTPWARWRADRRGLAAVEFALVLPFLLILYLGGFAVSQAVGAYRKVSDTTVELANVTAQYTTMSAVDTATVESAGTQIMAPYPTQNLSIVFSEITTDANNKATVTWSCASTGGTRLTDGSVVTLPTGMSSVKSNYILVQASYLWVPPIQNKFIGSVPMSNQIYVIPRNSASISNTDPTC
jgi:Flp pilus assembly protein TadG